ncbi:hypothetical protein MMC24_004571 [Lignoscripta atroalba]|nr:hypothetical protein [Lignoscripta atroalba]
MPSIRLPSIEMLAAVTPVQTPRSLFPSQTHSSSDVPALQKIVQTIFQSPRLTIQQMEDIPNHLHSIRILHLSDGTRLLLKVSPPASAPLLKHERQGLETEALTLSLLGKSGLPVPSIINHDKSGKILGSPFLLTNYLPGTVYKQAIPFLGRAERVCIERQTSVLISTIAQHASSTFGPVVLVASGEGFESWREAYISMLESALRDAEDLLVNLPYAQIREQVRRAQGALDEVQEARLVILGLPNSSNVLIDVRTKELTGVIDFKRAVWGDAEMGKGGDLELGTRGLMYVPHFRPEKQ